MGLSWLFRFGSKQMLETAIRFKISY
jgi:hypothetical protein